MSRPRSVKPLRTQVGSCSASSGMSMLGRPSSSPLYRYTAPGSASSISMAALARANPICPPPNLVTVRNLSWLDSVQTGREPTALAEASELVMAERYSLASKAASRMENANAWCSSSGRM